MEERLEKLEKRLDTLEQNYLRLVQRLEDVEDKIKTYANIFDEYNRILNDQTDILRRSIEMLENADLPTMQSHITRLKSEMQGVTADIMAIKATQSDHGEMLKEQRELPSLVSTVQIEQGKKLDLILDLLQNQKKNDQP